MAGAEEFPFASDRNVTILGTSLFENSNDPFKNLKLFSISRRSHLIKALRIIARCRIRELVKTSAIQSWRPESSPIR
jgi:hypothetical protein